jgi:cell division protein FtsI/penicillin-binding protein 2
MAEVGEVETDGDSGTASFDATLDLQGVGPWRYEGRLDLARQDGEWRVAWGPGALHPALADGRTIRVLREQGLRAGILAADGQPLAVGGPGESARLTDLGAALLGDLRPLAPPEATALGLTYAPGDLVGGGGVESGFEPRLASGPQGQIEVVEAGRVVEVVHTFGSERPDPLQLTIDYTTQRAAEAAVAGVTLPVALVAIDSRTGAIRAVANNPPGYDRALLGVYPPGSTFKIVTAAGALAAGTTPGQMVECPLETQVGDSAVFTNADGHDLGSITFTESFAESCNTTFIEQGYALGATGLLEVAETFGFNDQYRVGLPLEHAGFPVTESDTELAAASIGQGRVTVTPLHMATVAAAAYDGTWRPPFLTGEPDVSAAQPLPPEAAALPELMREVVRSGTGVAAAVPGRDVGGKTGTAEFGLEDPPETHAWFAGFVGDLAYAVVVEGGGVGGEVAAPIARQFIEGLPPG